MDVNFEYINPFDEKYDYLMRAEHLGRYFLAADVLKGFNKVLDVACADGYGTGLLSKNVSKIVGVDRNKDYLEIAQKKYGDENIEFKCIDVDTSEITDMYDGIVCFETLEHLKHPEVLLRNLYKILSEDGVLLLSIPNSNYEIIENGKNQDSFHLHVFEYDTIIDLIRKVGFNIEKVYGQSYINGIVNKEITDYHLTDIINDAKTIAYPNEDEIEKTYSYIFILNKRVDPNE